MKKIILGTLYSAYANKKNLYSAERFRIAQNRNSLRKTLDISERKLLLSIIDDNDLIIEKASTDNFVNGVSVGMRLMMEALYRTE